MRRALLFALLLPACRDAEPVPTGAGPTAPEQVEVADTAFGSWRIEWWTEPAVVPLNEPFEVLARVLDPATGAPAGAAELDVDATMPQHMHGMNRVAELSSEGEVWRARGMLFHMPGSWELTFDVSADGITERAAVEVVLE